MANGSASLPQIPPKLVCTPASDRLVSFSSHFIAHPCAVVPTDFNLSSPNLIPKAVYYLVLYYQKNSYMYY